MTMLIALTLILTLTLIISTIFAWAAIRFALPIDPIVEQINQILPQTQCGQCGYPGCKPYAAAIARNEANINQCPPGGAAGVNALAKLLGRNTLPLNPDNGVEKEKVVALIREIECIGCTKCIQVCPVDAIIGAPKLMHTVLADLCTGCELCLPACPVDCIDLLPAFKTNPLKVDSLNLTLEN